MFNPREKVIKFLLSIEREYKSNKLSINISRNNFESSKISSLGEEKFINQLAILETEGLIKVNFHTGHRSLQYYITIELYEPIINYFNKKKRRKTHNFIEVIKWLVPTCISILALLKSYHIV